MRKTMENEKNLEETPEEVTPAEAETPAEEATIETPVEENTAEEAPVEEYTAEEVAAAEETAEDVPAQTGKATPGKIALMIVAIVLVAALIVGLLASGMGGKQTAESAEETIPVETAVPATVPADGNPDDETCKGTYTVTDEEAAANMNTVVATAGDHTLTNGQLQVFYWMQVQNFLASDYGSYMLYYGVLDYTQPLDTQLCVMEEGLTWQQFFLKEALKTWQNYCALSDNAKNAGMELPEESQAILASIEETLAQSASYYGLESVEELMKFNVGAGASVQDYASFQQLLMEGNLYYDAEYAKLTATEEEMETFFAEHESEYAESGITKDGKYVDVRHILVMPKGGTADETGATTYSDEEWQACADAADEILKLWQEGEQTEDAFAALANEKSEDPGSNTNGGLYENVYEGQMVAEFEQWCFDETRVQGDTGIVKTTYGYHVMYFVGSKPIWKNYVRQDIITQKSKEMMENLIADYAMDVDYSAITLGLVNLAN